MGTLNIILIVALALIIVGLIVFYLIKGIKEKWLSEVLDCVSQAIKEAEKQFGPGQGDAKQVYVLKKVRLKCEELKIPYALIETLIVALINQIIAHYNIIVK